MGLRIGLVLLPRSLLPYRVTLNSHSSCESRPWLPLKCVTEPTVSRRIPTVTPSGLITSDFHLSRKICSFSILCRYYTTHTNCCQELFLTSFPEGSAHYCALTSRPSSSVILARSALLTLMSEGSSDSKWFSIAST